MRLLAWEQISKIRKVKLYFDYTGNEYQVQVHENNKCIPDETYFTSDHQDAIDTYNEIKKLKERRML